MYEHDDLLNLMRETARDAVHFLLSESDTVSRGYKYSSTQPGEMKASVDKILNERITTRLAAAELPVLSEESEVQQDVADKVLRFVVDPLDGTVNYIRELGPASVSIALCDGCRPLCGVMATYPAGDLAWGSGAIGAFLNDAPIAVSGIDRVKEAVLCTGIPVRLALENAGRRDDFARGLGRYGKVRMLGSASVSLLSVARGSAEVYTENDIMIWDVAAGLAIVEGAGGFVRLEEGSERNAVDVYASNGRFDAH